MSGYKKDDPAASSIRLRAVQTLIGASSEMAVQQGAASALGVLHKLAVVANTAPDALAILHELQVHQVEIDLQDEELRATRAELERALRRQTQLYDHAPIAYFTLNQGLEISELNLRAAHLLGEFRSQLIGANMLAYIKPPSRAAFEALVGTAKAGSGTMTSCPLQLAHSVDGLERGTVVASASADPDGPNILLTLLATND